MFQITPLYLVEMYTTSLKRIGKPSGRVDLVIDSTGLVIHGEGRWTRDKHGKRNVVGGENYI